MMFEGKGTPRKFSSCRISHNSCHGVRELTLSTPSELQEKPANKIIELLKLKEGITVKEPDRKDECCGFGGMFAVEEPYISTAWVMIK